MTKPATQCLRFCLLLIICLVAFRAQAAVGYFHLPPYNPCPIEKSPLLNGRIWHNQYTNTTGDQFFLTNLFVKGYVIFNGVKYSNLDLLFDIANDELILKTESYPIIMLNKEMADSFCLVVDNRKYFVINAGNDTANILRGYVNVLYTGPTSLYVKFSKKVQPLGSDGKNDLFIEEQKVYLKHDGKIITVWRKKDLYEILDDRKMQIINFIKSNKIKINHKDPYSYIRVLKYYDSLMN